LASAAGNGLEVRNAVDFLTGRHQDARLREVTLALCAEVVAMAGIASSVTEARRRVDDALGSGRAAERFSRMVAGLGGPPDFVERMDGHLEQAPIIRDVFAPGQGTVAAIDTRSVGMAVVVLGGGRTMPTDSIDHAVGFDHLLGLGATVDALTPIARIHARDEASAAAAEVRLKSAYRLADTAPVFPLIADTITSTA
jgi:thymidine phosphorylase